MPFHDNVYHPLEQDGAHISPVLNSPWMPRSFASPAMPSPGQGPLFKFSPRHQSVDWRRIGAIDVDRVANELDFQTLQDNIMNITFCSVENEKCPRCHSSLDPVLIKLIRLTQFTIEYLLHSQEYLTSNLHMLEDKLRGAATEADQLQLKLTKQTTEMKALKDQCKLRKKMIAAQQMMISASAGGYHKCQHCEKSFVNYSYLENHIKRRHADNTSSGSKENQIPQPFDKLHKEINLLKEELQLTKKQLDSEKTAHLEKLSQLQESEKKRTMEQDIMKTFDKWKAEERDNFEEEMKKVKEMFMKDLKELTEKNSSLENVSNCSCFLICTCHLHPPNQKPHTRPEQTQRPTTTKCYSMNELLKMKQQSLQKRSGLGALEESSQTDSSQRRARCQHDIENVKELLQKQVQFIHQLYIVVKHLEDKLRKCIDELKQDHERDKKHSIQLLQQQHEQEKVKAIQLLQQQHDGERKRAIQLLQQEFEREKNRALDQLRQEHDREKREKSQVKELSTKPLSVKKSVSEQTHVLETIQELAEEKDLDVDEQQLPMNYHIRDMVKNDHSLRKALRKVLEQGLEEKLESLGVKEVILQRKRKPSFRSTQEEAKIQARYPVPVKSSTPKVKLVSSKEVSAGKPPSLGTPPFTSDDESEAEDLPLQSLRPSGKGTVSFVASESDPEGSLLEEIKPQPAKRSSLEPLAPSKPARVSTIATHVKEPGYQSSVTWSSGLADSKRGDLRQEAVKKDPVMELKLTDLDGSDFDSSSMEEEPYEVPRPAKSLQEAAVPKKQVPASSLRKNPSSVNKLFKADAREADTSSTLVSVSDFSDTSDI
ncbi:cilium assembly protein DZIP1 [Gastrophryne carolinensis]